MTTISLGNGSSVAINGVPVIFPTGFDINSFQDQINSAAYYGNNGQGLGFLFENFIWGGLGDLQRPQGAIRKKGSE